MDKHEVTIRRASLRHGERTVKQGAVTRKEKAWHDRRRSLSAKTKQAARRRYNRARENRLAMADLYRMHALDVASKAREKLARLTTKGA